MGNSAKKKGLELNYITLRVSLNMNWKKNLKMYMNPSQSLAFGSTLRILTPKLWKHKRPSVHDTPKVALKQVFFLTPRQTSHGALGKYW